jgi:hypothetical protein
MVFVYDIVIGVHDGSLASLGCEVLLRTLYWILHLYYSPIVTGLKFLVVLQAYLTICDLLVVFCDQLGNNPQLVELVYEADRGLQIQLNDFIQNYVFIMEEDGKLLLAC